MVTCSLGRPRLEDLQVEHQKDSSRHPVQYPQRAQKQGQSYKWVQHPKKSQASARSQAPAYEGDNQARALPVWQPLTQAMHNNPQSPTKPMASLAETRSLFRSAKTSPVSIQGQQGQKTLSMQRPMVRRNGHTRARKPTAWAVENGDLLARRRETNCSKIPTSPTCTRTASERVWARSTTTKPFCTARPMDTPQRIPGA